MKTEKELKNFLRKCDKVRNFGMSNGPCPFIECSDEELEENKLGCCAECSTPATIAWVLELGDHPTDNMQHVLANAFKKK
jgi:hypothetical protein